MRKNKILWITALLVFCLSFGLNADAAKKDIAYVDISRIFDSYGKTKSYDAELEKKYNAYEQEHNKKLEKIRDAEGRLSLLKENERKKLQAEIDADKAALSEFDRQQQTDLRKDRDERIREILVEIEKVIKDFAQAGGYSIIINDRVLIYGNESLDITEDVIKHLNKK